jgi:hypothetical protein
MLTLTKGEKFMEAEIFTVSERDRIIAWWTEPFFFFPYVYFQFHT